MPPTTFASCGRGDPDPTNLRTVFFADSTGYLALLSLLVQCVLAWVFAVFLGVMRPGHAGWLHSLFAGFVGMGIGLTALGVRFLLAHQGIAGSDTIPDGSPACRLLYGTYLGGKALFYWGLVRGVRAWRGRPLRSVPPLPVAIVAAAFGVGAGVSDIGSVLLVHAPFAIGAGVHCVWLLRAAGDEPRELGRATVRGALAATSLAWTVYALAVLVAGPDAGLLRFNSLIDLVLVVVLAVGVIVAVMSAAQARLVRAHAERDRLHDRVLRDEKLRSMATLVSGVAHEINNPLTAILGFAGDLTSDDGDLRSRAARIVREQAERCCAIVKRLSMLGRRRTAVPSRFDVAAALQRVLDGLEARIAAAAARIELAVSPVDLDLTADVTGFEQVATNLVVNALSVSPSGGRVRVCARGADGGVELTVEDEGPGVPAGVRERIFEPFWTTRSDEQGTGLGLAVVDAIVGEHGGRIDVEEGALGGARFRAVWPAGHADVAASAVSLPAAAGGTAGGSAALLVVDDERAVRESIARHATARGWRVHVVDSASTALDYLLGERGECDAIVCDLRMPGLSGVDFHDELARRAPQLLRRTVFMTGAPSSEDAVAFAARCRTEILAKPFAPEDLLRRLGRAMRAG